MHKEYVTASLKLDVLHFVIELFQMNQNTTNEIKIIEILHDI